MDDNVKNNWGSYRSAVIASGVPEKNADWFVRWAQKFSRSIKGESLQERSAADIRKFLYDLHPCFKQTRAGGSQSAGFLAPHGFQISNL
jgi:hypothetical protein